MIQQLKNTLSLKDINSQFERNTICVSNNRLQLRFTYRGKRETLSLGLKDNPQNRKLAIAKAVLLDYDILNNSLDTITE